MHPSAGAVLLRNTLYRGRALLLLLLWPLLYLYRLRYRNKPAVKFEPVPEAEPLPLEGYTDKLWYQPGQEIAFFLKAETENNLLVIERFLAAGQYEAVASEAFGKLAQPVAADAPRHGCNWKKTLVLCVDSRFTQGYYRAKLQNSAGDAISYICFLVGPAKPAASIAVLAPICTWLAYNPYGGKSLYNNQADQENVYYVSALRPNHALQFNPIDNVHAWEVEANIFCWLNRHYGADLYPDYQLENINALTSYNLVTLAYHCEYVSAKMYSGLRELVNKQHKSLLALGGNQIYWQTRWHADEQVVECRKDASRFSDNSGHGSTWNKTTIPEDELLGCRFTDPGTGTYAPYSVTAPTHWLYQGCQVKVGTVFGEGGITELPICGDETDKSTLFSRITTQVIAKGLNKAEIGKYDIYEPGNATWNGQAGGEIAFTPLSVAHAVLHTGSIQSGSGLGTDSIFTCIVSNFLNRYTK